MSLKPRCVDFDSTWKQILETVRRVIVGEKVERADWNDRFSDVYALCVCYPEPQGNKLYSATKEFLEEHIKKKYELVRASGDENLLCIYSACWDEYSHGCNYLDQLYGYLNSQFIKKQRTVSDADMNYGGVICDQSEHMFEIGELGLDIWKRLLVEPLKDSLISLLLKEVHTDRCHGTVNQAILHNVIHSFVRMEKYKVKNAIKYYEDTFEAAFLKSTGDYYKRDAQNLFDKFSCSEYMEKALQRLDDENLRSRKFLNSTSYVKVTQELQQRLVADHLQTLHDECRELVQKEKRHDLANMYALLNPIHNGLGVLVQETESYIRQTSLNTVKSIVGDNMATLFVESMLDIHTKYQELIQAVFCGDQQFIGALDRACSVAINYKVNPKACCRAPELLSKYCDGLLKRSVKGISETEADDKLSSSITIFKYLDDKDVYNRYYARMLARRLIYGASHSMDAEEAMITRLKQACGYEFTNKLHRMFTDMSISADLNTKFGGFIKDGENAEELGVNFSILVLQAGAWPVESTSVPSFALPQELEKSVRSFEKFYAKNFTGRKLTWIHAFCHADVKLNYLKRAYFITMGTYLMSVLLPFNNSLSLTFKELSECTQLERKDLLRQTQLILDSKLILTDDAEITDDTVFRLNMSYNNKRNKFKLLSSQKDTAQEIEQTHNAVDEDRKLYLQAAIVRVMKSRRILKHNLLIQEVLGQSQARFAPSVPMIKKCIESLIDKQYIERTNGSTDEYSYVA